jgi:hypothetical protein
MDRHIGFSAFSMKVMTLMAILSGTRC